MVNIGRDDGAAAGDLGADELRGDDLRDGGAEGLTLVLEGQVMAPGRFWLIGREAHILADSDILHLRRDDTLLSIGELGRALPGLTLIDLTVGTVELDQAIAGGRALGGLGVLPRKIAIVFWLQLATGNRFHVSAFKNPRGADVRKTLLDVAMEGGIAPGTRRIVDADRLVGRLGAIGAGGIGQFHLSHRYEDVRARARHVNTGRVREVGRLVVGDHGRRRMDGKEDERTGAKTVRAGLKGSRKRGWYGLHNPLPTAPRRIRYEGSRPSLISVRSRTPLGKTRKERPYEDRPHERSKTLLKEGKSSHGVGNRR